MIGIGQLVLIVGMIWCKGEYMQTVLLAMPIQWISVFFSLHFQVSCLVIVHIGA